MPIWILILDYILGIIMYTLIGRAAMNIFQKEDSNFFFMRVFVQFTNTIKVALSLRFTHHLHSIISTAFFHR